jgi:hypothetical protein
MSTRGIRSKKSASSKDGDHAREITEAIKALSSDSGDEMKIQLARIRIWLDRA